MRAIQRFTTRITLATLAIGTIASAFVDGSRIG
jgi:hypothetical protein